MGDVTKIANRGWGRGSEILKKRLRTCNYFMDGPTTDVYLKIFSYWYMHENDERSFAQYTYSLNKLFAWPKSSTYLQVNDH